MGLCSTEALVKLKMRDELFLNTFRRFVYQMYVQKSD